MSDSVVIQAVHRIAVGLFSRPKLDDILRETLAAALDSVDALAGTIYLHDPKDDTLVFRHVVGGDPAVVGVRIPSNKGIAGVVFQSAKGIVTGNAAQDSRHLDVASGYRTDSMATTPIRNLGGRTIGVMQVLNRRDGGAFQEEPDLVVLETLASLAATAIENAHQAELEHKAVVADKIGDIAHDIKNMMTPVETWGQTLEFWLGDALEAIEHLESSATETQRDAIKQIRLFLDLIPEAVSGIKDGAQEAKDRGKEIADAVKGEVKPPQFRLDDCTKTVLRVCKTLNHLAEDQGVHLSMEGCCPPFPHDRSQFFNAIYNLVNNAIPYVPTGGSVRVCLSHDDEFAEVAVIDTGSGMPAEIRQSILSGNAKSTTPGGTGLGTGIVMKVVKLHGGKVDIESELGKGTTFRLRFPLHRPEIEDAETAAEVV